MTSATRALRLSLAVSLVISTALFVFWSRHWPLVGDASLMHYIGFLIEHGRAPYRDLGDMDMPGTFLIEMAAMKVFGGGAAGLRLFDFTLLGVAAGSYVVVTKRAGWFAAVFAGALFALVHGRDGMAQGGQRDLTIAALLLAATAVLFVAIRRRAWWGMVGFGLLSGIALTIKPTPLPLSLGQLLIAAWVMPKPDFERDRVLHPVWTVFWAGVGLLVGPLVSLGFLLQQRAVGAFWVSLRTVVPYYQSLGHRPLAYLLSHSVSPLIALVLIWFAVLALARPRLDWQRGLLLCGAGFALAAFVFQARGWPYHRYPLLAFLLPLMAMDFSAAMELLQTRAPQLRFAAALSMVALCVGGFWIGPQSALQIHRFRWWQTDFITTLEGNLDRLGGAGLAGRVQCIDWFSGCGTTLYKMRLMPATGVLSDFLLFGPPDKPAIQQARAMFGEAFVHPPKVIVVSSYLQFSGPGNYEKLDLWPELKAFLDRDYRLDTDWKPTRTERWWNREELPYGYRIYVRKETEP
jgi:hypothetical protein